MLCLSACCCIHTQTRPTAHGTAHARLQPRARRELGAELECRTCDRLLHPLCLHHPAVSAAELPGGMWACPCCGEEQQVGQAREGEEGGGEGGDVERMGLTPDWIIVSAVWVRVWVCGWEGGRAGGGMEGGAGAWLPTTSKPPPLLCGRHLTTS